jgi:hypothetical protein
MCGHAKHGSRHLGLGASLLGKPHLSSPTSNSTSDTFSVFQILPSLLSHCCTIIALFCESQESTLLPSYQLQSTAADPGQYGGVSPQQSFMQSLLPSLQIKARTSRPLQLRTLRMVLLDLRRLRCPICPTMRPRLSCRHCARHRSAPTVTTAQAGSIGFKGNSSGQEKEESERHSVAHARHTISAIQLDLVHTTEREEAQDSCATGVDLDIFLPTLSGIPHWRAD